jgi:translation initiation factor 2B subunit (eIF-2B alpha/beta/delta family)
MVKVSKESLETFQSVLETIDTSWQTEFNLRETVRQSFELIKKAKQHKVSWEKIAEILKQSSGVIDGISPESIRQYYFEFSKNPDLLLKKRKSSQNKKKSKDSTFVNSASKIEKIDSETSDINSSTVPELEPESTLNVQSAPEPIPELEPEMPSSESQGVSQSAASKPNHKAKDAVRSQFNLGRRGK